MNHGHCGSLPTEMLAPMYMNEVKELDQDTKNTLVTAVEDLNKCSR